MEKQKVMFAFNDDKKWSKIIYEAEGMLNNDDLVEKVVIVAMGTAILSVLKSDTSIEFKEKVTELSGRGVDFYICVNAMSTHGITPEMILPEIKIAPRGTNIKILELHQAGYMMYTVEYI